MSKNPRFVEKVEDIVDLYLKGLSWEDGNGLTQKMINLYFAQAIFTLPGKDSGSGVSMNRLAYIALPALAGLASWVPCAAADANLVNKSGFTETLDFPTNMAVKFNLKGEKAAPLAPGGTLTLKNNQELHLDISAKDNTTAGFFLTDPRREKDKITFKYSGTYGMRKWDCLSSNISGKSSAWMKAFLPKGSGCELPLLVG